MTADMFDFMTGPVSIIIGVVILLLIGLFVSFFIGEQIIISGIKEEKRTDEKTEKEIKREEVSLKEIKKDIEEILLTLKCPSCRHKMVYSPEIGVEEGGSKVIFTKNIPYSKVLGKKICQNCALILDFDELLIIRDILERENEISRKILDYSAAFKIKEKEARTLKTRGRKKKIFISSDQLRYELLEGGKTYQAIGTENNSSSREAVRQIAKKSLINLRDRQLSWYAEHWGVPELKTQEWLLEQKEKGNLGLKNLAAQLQISVWVLRSQITRLGLNLKDFIKRAKIIEMSCS